GSAPNRTYTVEWSQMDAWQEGTGVPARYECVKMSIQAILYETSNQIEFRYLPVNEDTCGKNSTADIGYSVGGHSTIGIQGATTGVLVESASCSAADGVGPQVVGTIADAGAGFPDICTATKGYLFVPPTAGCP